MTKLGFDKQEKPAKNAENATNPADSTVYETEDHTRNDTKIPIPEEHSFIIERRPSKSIGRTVLYICTFAMILLLIDHSINRYRYTRTGYWHFQEIPQVDNQLPKFDDTDSSLIQSEPNNFRIIFIYGNSISEDTKEPTEEKLIKIDDNFLDINKFEEEKLDQVKENSTESTDLENKDDKEISEFIKPAEPVQESKPEIIDISSLCGFLPDISDCAKKVEEYKKNHPGAKLPDFF